MSTHGHASRRNGRSITYISWSGMVQRTTNFQHKSFPDYAEHVNPEFLGPGGFARFLAAVGERPSVEHTLDRIDNNRGYFADNLRWAKKSTQEQNKVRAQYYGRTTAEWAMVLNLRPTTIRKRIERGWDHARAFPVEYRLDDSTS